MRIVLAVTFLAAIGAVACSGGDEAVSSPTPSGPADLSPRVASIDAMRRYLSGEGVGGRKGQFSEPVDCAELPEDGGEAEFCIIDGASTFAPGLAILYVARIDSRNSDRPEEFEDVWEVHLEPGEIAWQVTDVEEVPPP
jgi:hypothetical protein